MDYTREDYVRMMQYEADAVKRYAAAAERYAAEGHTAAAWEMADIAKTAATCAMQAHERLWEISGGNLTEEEFEVFCLAEEVQYTAKKAARAAAESLRK